MAARDLNHELFFPNPLKTITRLQECSTWNILAAVKSKTAGPFFKRPAIEFAKD
jgi:hypothetical protein